VGHGPAPSLDSATLPRVWQGIGYRPLPDVGVARPLFDFAAIPWPDPARVTFGWGAFAADAGHPGERLLGVLLAEGGAGIRSLMLHGPVVQHAEDPLEVAAQLVAAAVDHGAALGADTLFTRPQGLDRVWIRFGFFPLPESTLPAALAGRPGAGLYAWRGGSALWLFRGSAAGAR
jgi:hypothetical protein